MGIIGGVLARTILEAIAKPQSVPESDAVDPTEPSLEQCFGKGFFRLIKDRTVLDFGSGHGRQSVEMAQRGAAQVIGLDLQDRFVQMGRQLASVSDVAGRCKFTTKFDGTVDIVVSKDAFEHFDNPLEVLRAMRYLLKPDGVVLVSFGPTWFHPRGGHLFSVFPWAHLVFTENALLRWRAKFRTDGATRFSEVEGGLNQMTIRRFEKLVEQSPLKIEKLELVPIRGVRALTVWPLREFGTAMVRCQLCPRDATASGGP